MQRSSGSERSEPRRKSVVGTGRARAASPPVWGRRDDIHHHTVSLHPSVSDISCWTPIGDFEPCTAMIRYNLSSLVLRGSLRVVSMQLVQLPTSMPGKDRYRKRSGGVRLSICLACSRHLMGRRTNTDIVLSRRAAVVGTGFPKIWQPAPEGRVGSRAVLPLLSMIQFAA